MRTRFRRSRRSHRPSLSVTIVPSAGARRHARLSDAGSVPKAVLWASLGLLPITTPSAQGQSISITGTVSPSTPVVPTWNIGSYLEVGDLTPGTLTVADGAGVTSAGGFILRSSTATITGAGSTWTNSSNLTVYMGGTLNVTHGGGYSGQTLTLGLTQGEGTLRVEDGGSVVSTTAFINLLSTATVTGAGSTWTNSGDLTLGSAGAFNTIVTSYLNVEAGGAVSNANGYLGSLSGTVGIATVTGAGSTWTNNGVLMIGVLGAGSLDVEAGGRVSSAGGFILNSGSTATVTGTGSTWINSGELRINGSPETSLRISDGAGVSNTGGTIAGERNSRGTVTVTGAGSTWTNSGTLNIGTGLQAQGTLNVEAGGSVSSSSSAIVNSSTVTVTGAGSTWTNNGDLFMYLGGSVHVKDGGSLSSGTITLGTPHGYSQGIRIEGGGSAASTAGYIGQSSTATITGAGSTWTNSGELIVGDFATGTLTVEAGGTVSNTNGHLGYLSRYLGAASSATGIATITGAGSTWTNSGNLILGGSSPTTATSGSGTLNILDGGLVSVGGATKAHVGSTINLNRGTLGTGSLDVTNATLNHLDGTLRINGGAYSQSAGALVLSGGTVSAKPRLELLNGATTTGIESVTVGDLVDRQGELLVSGGGTLTGNGRLTVGNRGAGTLNVAAGGHVANHEAILGREKNSTGAATVTGVGSTWTNDGELHVGYGGTGLLNIEAGGRVSNREGAIGRAINSTGTATVTGAGSTWTNNGWLYIGYDGTGTLNIGAYDRSDTAGTVTATRITTGNGSGTINFNQTGAITFSVPISGNISVHQRGGGITTLDGNHTYTGITTVSDGALVVNGSLANTSVNVADGGTLGGSGSIMKITLDEGARLAPGDEIGVSLGTLSAGSLTWQPGARLVFDLGPATSDLLDLGGAFTKTGFSDYLFDFVDAGWQAGQTYTLVHFSDTNFTAEDFGFTNDGGFDGVFGLDNGALTFHVTAVPEPSAAAALAGLGALGTVACRRRRRAG